MKNFKKIKIIVASSLLLVLIVVAGAGRSQAQSSTPVVEAFFTPSALQYGTIVQLQSKGSNTVIPLTQTNETSMYGVVVSANSSQFTLSNPGATGTQAYVATSGTYNVFVSTQNGNINSGDGIAISSVDGVGMKADSSESIILGKALSGFNGSNALSSTTLKSATGSNVKVEIGSVPVSINVAHNPLDVANSANLPSFLEKAATAVTNKQVTSAKIYLGIIVILITAILSGGLLYSGVRSSIIAIGRNPLSRKSVLRGLLQVTLIALTIFILGLFGVYLLLIL